ncbi:MAG TPA: hypothetical protein DCE10_06835 [Acidimicrobiaceae bacterium]|nr:hypothetical protein [Acidimicrobiaceae bacterium]
MDESLEDLCDRLREISDELADLGMSVLQEAIDSDGAEAKRPELEKRLSRARRAVEKATAILSQGPESTVI